MSRPKSRRHGPARVVPAPPSARGAVGRRSKREGRNLLRPDSYGRDALVAAGLIRERPGSYGRDALRRVRSHPPFLPQNTQKPLRGTLKTQKSGPLSYISNTFRVFSDGLRPFRVFSGKTPFAPASPCPASGRLTRSARRHGDTERGFEAGLRPASSTIRPLREGRAPSRPPWNADASHAQIWQRPMWLRRPEYRATPQSVFAKVRNGNLRGPAWVGGSRSCATGCPPTWPGTRSTRAALGAWRCGVSPADPVLGGDGPLFIKCGQGQPRLRERTTRGEPWLREASAERSWSIFPGHRRFYSSRRKRRGALMSRIPPVADTDGTDLALPLEVAR